MGVVNCTREADGNAAGTPFHLGCLLGKHPLRRASRKFPLPQASMSEFAEANSLPVTKAQIPTFPASLSVQCVGVRSIQIIPAHTAIQRVFHRLAGETSDLVRVIGVPTQQISATRSFSVTSSSQRSFFWELISQRRWMLLSNSRRVERPGIRLACSLRMLRLLSCK